MELALVARAKGAGATHGPAQSEAWLYPGSRGSPGRKPPRVQGRDGRQEGGAGQQLRLGLEPPRPEDIFERPREPRDGKERALENALSLDVAKQGWAFANQQVGV